MQKIAYQDLIKQEELQHLQDEFSLATGVCVYCLDAEGNEITRLSGGENAEEMVQQYAVNGLIRSVLDRVEEGSLEDLATTESDVTGGKVAAVAVRMEERTVLVWVVLQTGLGAGNLQFENILDLLRDVSISLLESKRACLDAELENRRNINEKQEMSHDLHVVEATTEIIQLLDSDEPVEKLMERCLQSLGHFLEADSAQIFQLRADEQVMDVMSEWLKDGASSHFDKTNGIETVSFLRVNKPVIVSADAPAGEYHNDLVQLGLQAVMVFPILQQENASAMVLALNCRDHKPNWSMQDIKFISDAVKVLQSIMTRRIQSNSISGARLALKEILDNVSCAIYVVDRESGERLFANQKLQRQFVMELQDGSFADFLQKAIGEHRVDSDFEIYHQDVERWYRVLRKDITWTDGRDALIYSFEDITDKKQVISEMEEQSLTDGLTGLHNRPCMEKDLAKLIMEAKESGQSGALLYLDLDDFKQINDSLGHQYGDALLKAIAHALQRVEGISHTCYRMGGDEIAILVPPASFPGMQRIIREIQEIFGKPWFLKNKDYYCTMSMGTVVFPDSGDSVQELEKMADAAMYESKKNGKNRCSSYEEGLLLLSEKNRNMEKYMQDAILHDYREFEVYYQPVVEITEFGTECKGAEALVRWNSEQMGLLLPEDFLPLAEYLGLITGIGKHVMMQACKACRGWNESGYPDYKVHVNLSMAELLQKDLLRTVQEVLARTGLEAGNLVLEVKESLSLKDLYRGKEILEQLQSLGVQIALDDFGTGYSSLTHLRTIPFDLIKVDCSVVSELVKDAYSQAFVRSITDLARTLGAKVCVEGIETTGQSEVVQKLQVPFAQGYCFDKPLPRREFEEKYIDSVKFI